MTKPGKVSHSHTILIGRCDKHVSINKTRVDKESGEIFREETHQ